jgi:hypothetical protein
MIYRHSKTGHEYVVITEEARHSETLKYFVVYQRIDTGEFWIRPRGMFFETVVIDGVAMLRFEPELEEVDTKPRC